MAKKEQKKVATKMRRQMIEDIEESAKQPPFKIKYNKPGQPTKYDKKYDTDMLRYFESVVEGGYYEQYVEEQVAGKDAKVVKVIKSRAKAIPMFEKYALAIGVDDDTLRNWAIAKDEQGKLKHKEFFGAYKKCLGIQAMMMKELGMNGSYVANIVKFLLSAEHGIYDIKEESDNTAKGKATQEINNTSIDNILQEALNV